MAAIIQHPESLQHGPFNESGSDRLKIAEIWANLGLPALKPAKK